MFTATKSVNCSKPSVSENKQGRCTLSMACQSRTGISAESCRNMCRVVYHGEVGDTSSDLKEVTLDLELSSVKAKRAEDRVYGPYSRRRVQVRA